MDSDEDLDCPLCMEELDIADRNFRPCTCGYQICRFCWHHIKTNLNGRCPACRREYSEEMVEFEPVSADELSRIRKEKKEKERQQKDMESANRRHLSSMRVVQKNLVYIIGLHPRLATEEIVRSHDFFGQFGKISKIVINKRPSFPASQMTTLPSAAVYVTYFKKEDAAKAIAAVDGSVIADRVLRASYGTTKYCTYYLRNMTCPNPNCLYLHEQGEDIDTISKEELATGKHHMRDMLSNEDGMEDEDEDYLHTAESSSSSRRNNHTPKLSNADFPPAVSSKAKANVTDDSALPAHASWAKLGNSSGSTPTTPVMAVSDAFGPTLSAAVAASQQKTNFPPMPKRKSEKKKRKELQKQAATTPESISATLSQLSIDESSPKRQPSMFEQGLTGFVLGQAYRDLCPLPTEEEFEQKQRQDDLLEQELTLGVSALLDDRPQQPSPAQRHLEAIQSAQPRMAMSYPSVVDFLTYSSPTPDFLTYASPTPKYNGRFNPFAHQLGNNNQQQQLKNALDASSPIRRHSRFGFAQA